MSRLAEIRSISSLEAATDADLITAIAADEASKNDERKKEEQRVEKEEGGDKKEITTDISATKKTTTIATTTTIASTTTTTTNVIKTQKSHSLQKVAGAAPNDAENAENAENAQEEEEERDAVFHGDNREGKDAGFDSPARYFANATYPATNSPTLGWVIFIKLAPFVP